MNEPLYDMRWDDEEPCDTCGHPGTDHYRPPYAEDAAYEGTGCLHHDGDEWCECEWYLPTWIVGRVERR